MREYFGGHCQVEFHVQVISESLRIEERLCRNCWVCRACPECGAWPGPAVERAGTRTERRAAAGSLGEKVGTFPLRLSATGHTPGDEFDVWWNFICHRELATNVRVTARGGTVTAAPG